MEAKEALSLLGLPAKVLDQIRKYPRQKAEFRLAALKHHATQQYRALARILHPDVTGGDQQKAARFCQATTAYRLIADLNIETLLSTKTDKHSLNTKLGLITFELPGNDR